MRNLARKLDERDVFQDAGMVARVDGATLVVRAPSGEHRAKRALSCLLAPEAGDHVLLSIVRGDCYVLAVLERDGDGDATVDLDRNLAIKLGQGRFTVAAQEGVSLVSGKDVSVVSGEVNVSAVSGNVALQALSLVGGVVRAELEKVKLLAGTLDSVLDRFSQKVKRSYRFVEESDQLRAERVDYVAKKSMSLRGENTLITAEELVKIDGDQVHLG